MNEPEIWHLVVGNENYAVSSHGNIIRWRPRRHTVPLRPVRQYKTENGYHRVYLSMNGKNLPARVHALVCEAFIGPRPAGYEINHKDGDKSNNHLENLEYCTSRENTRHAIENGLFVYNLQNLHGGQLASRR